MEYIGFAERGLPNGAIAGLAKGGHSPRIVIGTHSYLAETVVYHEIGHIDLRKILLRILSQSWEKSLAAPFATGVYSAAPRRISSQIIASDCEGLHISGYAVNMGKREGAPYDQIK